MLRQIAGNNIHTTQAITNFLNMKKEKLTKIFTFSKADHSKVTNEEDEIMQDDNVKKLLNLCKFGNAKRLSKMQTYKHTNFDYIREISSEIIKFTNIERNVKEFGSYCINLNEKTSIDELMKEWMIDIIHD